MKTWKTHIVGWLAVAVLASGAWTGSNLLGDKPPKPAGTPGTALAPREKKPPKPVQPGGGKTGKIAEKFDVTGRVSDIAADGKSITLELAPEKKGDPIETRTIKFDAKTPLQYWWVTTGGARPTVGYRAMVRFAAGSKDTAERIVFVGADQLKGTQPQVSARVSSVTADGKSIVVQLRPKMKGDTGEERTIALPDAKHISFNGVAAGQAKPLADYHVMVWLKKGSNDAAERVVFQAAGEKAKGNLPGVDHAGRVIAVAADARSFTLEIAPKTKGEAAKTMTIKLDARAEMIFDGVSPGQAKPAVGQKAQVWLASGSKDTASKVRFAAMPTMSKGPSLSGMLVSASVDGKKLNLELHKKKGGAVETKEQAVQLAPDARLIYQAVGRDGAKPTKGYQAQVWLAEGSKDQAVLVVLQGTDK